ncbi:hypothetical protein [Rheinheimera sp. F8]|uniref:hypothetical protein n=1 Tax=Rheinheimera sp. F8 TaxID=1763998 RepID=UPI000AAF36D4|nr:hypothetical protein [Rheinheimera sp. F8]
MKMNVKQLSWGMLALQGVVILWLNQRSTLDPFSQLVLVPLLLLAGFALLTIQQRDE